MHLPSEHDTPIDRASIASMSLDDLHDRVEKLQERRLKSYNIYQAGIALKARAASEKAAAGIGKKLEQFEKKLIAVDKSLDALEKLSLDIQALRLIAGDDISNG